MKIKEGNIHVPFALSLSKGSSGAIEESFDKLRTNGTTQLHAFVYLSDHRVLRGSDRHGWWKWP
jgi:hypothetical protein